MTAPSSSSDDSSIPASEPEPPAIMQLAEAVRQHDAPDSGWAPGQPLGYFARRRGSGRRERQAGSPVLGIIAVCFGSIACAVGLLLIPARAFWLGDTGISYALGVFLALTACAMATGTLARRWELSRRLGTLGRWLGFAAPIAAILPVILLFGFNLLAAIVICLLVGIADATVLLFVTVVVDPMLGSE